MTRDEMARQEMTRDPIFLFETRYNVKGAWHAEAVFLSREEGEAYGEAHSYRWPGGWQVYCVPAEGQLAHVLNALDPCIEEAKP